MAAFFDIHLRLVVSLLSLLLLPLTLATWKGDGEPLEYFILEELPANTLIGSVAVDYKLTEKFNTTVLKTLTFHIDKTQSTKHRLFAIDNVTSIVRTTAKIDREAVCPDENVCIAWLQVVVRPAGITPDIRIMLEIVDVNDHRPLFPRKSVSIKMPESAEVGTFLDIPAAKDKDAGKNGVQSYELVSNTEKFELDVIETDTDKDVLDDSAALRLRLVSPLDREEGDSYVLKLVAHDGGNPPKSSSTLVNVTVEDINDHDPKFDNATYRVSVRENLPAGTRVTAVQARDFDLGDNAEIVYWFDSTTARTHGHLFRIDNKTGVIYQRKSLDFEKGSTYLLVVTARDRGLDSKPGQATVIVRVQDENDNSPEISIKSAFGGGGRVELSESARPGTFVGQLTVSDQDGGDNGKVQCTLKHDRFTLQKVYQARYRILTTGSLDREIQDEYTLTVVCEDMGVPPNTAMEDISLRVLDVNDNPPVFDQEVYHSTLKPTDTAGTPLLEVHATDFDKGDNAQVRYQLHLDASDMFQVDQTSGLVSTKSIFHLEQVTQMQFRVIAYDLGTPSLTGTATIVLGISDTTDGDPKFSQLSYEFGVFENMPPATEVGSIVFDNNRPRLGGLGELTDVQYGFDKTSDVELSRLFSIDPQSGKIETRAVLDRETQPVYYMTVVASRRGLSTIAVATSSVSVTIYIADRNDNPPVVAYPADGRNTTVTVPTNVPRDYNVIKIRAYDNDIGGNGKLTYSITEGNKDKFFDISPASGQVFVATDLTSVRTQTFTIKVEVADNGYPKLTAAVTFGIFVNQSVGLKPNDMAMVSASNATIVVAVTAATLITVFLVLFAVMMLLIWKRARPAWKKDRAEKYCYRNVQHPAGPRTVTGTTTVVEPGVARCEAGERTRDDFPAQPCSPQTNFVGGNSYFPKCNVVKSGECCLSIDCESCENSAQHMAQDINLRTTLTREYMWAGEYGTTGPQLASTAHDRWQDGCQQQQQLSESTPRSETNGSDPHEDSGVQSDESPVNSLGRRAVPPNHSYSYSSDA